MTDDTSKTDAPNDEPSATPAEGETPAAETPAEAPVKKFAPGEKQSFKSELRDAIGKAAGIAVETGSMLSGHSGEMVSAEGAVAEHDTEEFIDRIDGEG